MPIRRVVINSSDVARSVAFYTRFLDLEPRGEGSETRAVLDALTTSIDIRLVPAPRAPGGWIPDNLQQGFRHLGFKVTGLDDRAARMKAAGIPFLFSPIDIGNLRVCFFYDPDGTLVEMVEGEIHYTEIIDSKAVAEERALGAPPRPRFDHIALTVADREESRSFYAATAGFTLMGIIDPPIDLDGFSISYLTSGPVVLELFTFQRELIEPPVGEQAPGFAFVELEHAAAADLEAAAGEDDGAPVHVDSDGFRFTLSPQ